MIDNEHACACALLHILLSKQIDITHANPLAMSICLLWHPVSMTVLVLVPF